MTEKPQSRLAPVDEDRRLIEDIIPLREISEQSSKERSIRHGHPSTLHIWWARRPLAACRAAVFSAFIKDVRDPKQKESLNSFIMELCRWENSNKKSVIDKARKYILQDNEGIPPKVLDCFAGGGSIPLESARLGCDTYAIDLNPVAHIIELCTLVYPQKFGKQKLSDEGFAKVSNELSLNFKDSAKILFEEVKKEIGKFYPTDFDGYSPISYLWVRTVKCLNPKCQAEIPLFRQLWICKRKDKKVFLKPIINKKENRADFEVSSDSTADFDPNKGTMKMGSALCLLCNQAVTGRYIREQATKKETGERMVAVILSKDDSEKKYRPASIGDIKAFESAKRYLNSELMTKYKDLIPTEKIPRPSNSLKNGELDPFFVHVQIVNYGIEKWCELYNPRQLMTIISFIKKLNEMIPNKKMDERKLAEFTYLALAVDKLALYSTNQSLWVSEGEFIGQLFSQGQSIAMRWDYAEVNPFSGLTGSFESAIKWIIRFIEFASFIENPSKVTQGSATNLPYNKDYFDAVITDPPYYDAVPYSDVSDFFYVLLKRTLNKVYPTLFTTPLTPKSQEIIQNSSLVRRTDISKNKSEIKTKEFYELEMTKSFAEMYRVIKNNGILIVVFAHKSTAAWETLVKGLLSTNWVVTSSWPIHTERPGRLRSYNSAALASSIFIVCRKRKSEEEGYFNEVKEELKQKIKFKLDQFWLQEIRGADFFISAIGPAVEVFGKYKKVMKLSGEEVTVAELLDLVREIVTDYSLHQILKGKHMGNVDEQTRFYLLWRWAYDASDVPYDDARKLAQALGTEVDELLTRKDILQKKGDKVRLLEPWERQKNQHLGEQKGSIRAPMVDVIHKACLLWEKSAKNELAEFLESSGYVDRDTIWNVAQAISEVLPTGNKERQLIQGLLASRQSISQDAVESAKQGKLGDYVK